MNDLLLWAADHLWIWRPFAIAGLTVFALACLWYALAFWEGRK